MPSISAELVTRYIEAASVFAESQTERLALQVASDLLNAPSTWNWIANDRRRNPYLSPEQHEQEREVWSWEHLIRKELHIALCARSSRYRKYVEQISHNAHLLIGMIAVQIAGKLGIAVAVVAALVAAWLRLILSMGISVFCKRYKAGQL